VVLDALELTGDVSVVGLVDDDPAKLGTQIGDAAVLGDSGVLSSLREQGVDGAFVAIGPNDVRVEKGAELQRLGYVLVTVVHPSAVLGSEVTIGPGSVIMPGAILNAATRVGDNAIVNTGVTVDHDCVLEDGCHISPGAHLSGGVVVGAGAHVGTGASVLPDVRIGAGAVVGAGSVVLGDVPAGQTWVGNPARPLEKKG
jgi:sugar O-acyltransferase (sialic acid O-acetyltransferase NeuD family)